MYYILYVAIIIMQLELLKIASGCIYKLYENLKIYFYFLLFYMPEKKICNKKKKWF